MFVCFSFMILQQSKSIAKIRSKILGHSVFGGNDTKHTVGW